MPTSLCNIAASSGSSGGGQTIQVGDYSYPNARSASDFARYSSFVTTANQSTSRILPLGANTPGFYAGTQTTQGVYETLVNITGATNGGAILQLAVNKSSNAVVSTPTANFRITIDGGTSFLIGFTRSNDIKSTIFTAGFWEITSIDTYNHTAVNSLGSITTAPSAGDGNTVSRFANFGTHQGKEYHFVDLSTDSSAEVTATQYPPDLCLQLGFPFIHFSSSCLIEFAANSDISQYTYYSTIKTF